MEDSFTTEGECLGHSQQTDIAEDDCCRSPALSHLNAEQTITMAFLSLVDACGSSREFLERGAAFVARYSGCQAVGIRLAEGDGFPYFGACGFAAEFLAAENDICARDRAGRPQRDGRNQPVFQCLCGALVTGRCAVDENHLTPSGTFYANDLAGFVAGLSPQQRKSHRIRGRCAVAGYRSMALLPLHGKKGRIGVLQMNDCRKGLFTPAFLTLWERLAAKFSQALQKFQTEEALRARREELERKVAERTAQLEAANAALRESEMRFRQMAENIHEVFWLADLTATPGRILYISPACQEILGYSPRELCEHPRKWLAAVYLSDRRGVRRAFSRFSTSGCVSYHEYRIVRPDGSIRWVCNEGSPVRDAKGRPVRMAGVARDITERKCLQEELLRISEREQQHMGQELHDGICQHLTGTALVGKVLHNKMISAGDPSAREMERICRLLFVAVDETRQISHGLYPVRAEEGGLAAALARLAKTITALFPVRCVFLSRGGVNVIKEPAATHLYRIAQEAVNNAIKHGEAERVRITLRQKGGDIHLSIADNGDGIPEPLPPTHGIGLRIMAHRASEFGGQLKVERARGGGTVVVCSFPVEEASPGSLPPHERRNGMRIESSKGDGGEEGTMGSRSLSESRN